MVFLQLAVQVGTVMPSRVAILAGTRPCGGISISLTPLPLVRVMTSDHATHTCPSISRAATPTRASRLASSASSA